MGNVFSSIPALRAENVTGESETEIMATTSDDTEENEEFHDTIDDHGDIEERNRIKEAEMEKFRQQLQIKREQRREILDRHKNEKKELEQSLENEMKAKLEAYENNRLLRELLIKNNIEIPEDLKSAKENADISDTIVNMKEEFEKLRMNNNKLRRDLVESNSALQGAFSDIADLQLQNTQSMKQIHALKEVVSVSKTMLSLREQQLDELKSKLSEIEQSLADREANMLSADLRQEYERQLQNIRTLRGLYEERARLAEASRQGLLREVEEQKALKQAEIDKVIELTAKVENLESRVDELQETISNKNNQLYSSQDETRGLRAEMSAVNKLFSQVLLGYKNKQDLDKLVHRLEENHGLLTHMAENENDSEASTALPKLLLELISQVDENEENNDSDNTTKEAAESESNELNVTNANSTTAEEIVENLPKVWRVLMELLSHQSAPEDNASEKVTTCYKTVETKTGPVQVPSVSQTYIRLKDLILEKLGLVKEVNRMKQLNAHLETRLQEQERRLCLVTNELSKTWHVVGRLRRHHHQLHTHEKILKYELQQKRKLLNELKEELEYCREKWEQAREKNTQSEKDWKKLRAEFSSRKAKPSASFNHSAESGYSDERPSDESSESNDESEYVTEPLARSKKKLKKSFETILDSSTDLNLAAEREDPASDMLDVADLPLDTHDGDEPNAISDSCNSERVKSEIICETEDEVCDIAHDSCTEDLSTGDNSHESDSVVNRIKEEIPSISNKCSLKIPTIDPAAILESIKKQNERLAEKDKKLEKLEKSGEALLQKTQNTARIGEQLNSTLDHLLNRPSTSVQNNSEPKTFSLDKNVFGDKACDESNVQLKPILEDVELQNEQHVRKDDKLQHLNKSCNKIEQNISSDSLVYKNIDTLQSAASTSYENKNDLETAITELTLNPSDKEPLMDKPSYDPVISTVDFKAILNNVKLQNERLTKKDERLQQLESDCSNIISNLNNTLNTAQNITEKINLLQSSSKTEINNRPNKNDEESENESRTTISEDNTLSSSQPKVPIVDFKAILESVKRQDEQLARKEDRLNKLESACTDVVSDISNTINNGEEMIKKLDSIHASTSSEKNIESTENTTSNCSSRDSSEPLSEKDHEARFAARDLRLKRLEEQTKSLVNKVNKTTDKGVKIHYKLEELHNIYGSENSRASTPDNDVTESHKEEEDKHSGENSGQDIQDEDLDLD